MSAGIKGAEMRDQRHESNFEKTKRTKENNQESRKPNTSSRIITCQAHLLEKKS
jgi:hypothetical protein